MKLAHPFFRIISDTLDGLFLTLTYVCIYQIIPSTSFFLILISIFILEIWFWSKSTSLGKYLLNLKIVDKDTGKNLTMSRILIRELIAKPISGFLIIGYLLIILDKNRQGLHDKLINSIVIER